MVVPALTASETKIITEHAFNQDHFRIKGNNKLDKTIQISINIAINKFRNQ